MTNKYFIYNGCKFEEGFSPVLINLCGTYYLEGSFTSSKGFEWEEIIDPFLETSAREDSLIFECDSEETLYEAYKTLITELGNYEFNEEAINFIKNFKKTFKGE